MVRMFGKARERCILHTKSKSFSKQAFQIKCQQQQQQQQKERTVVLGKGKAGKSNKIFLTERKQSQNMSGCFKGGKTTLRVKQEKEQTDHGGGEEERDSKRPRTSTTNSNNIITGSDTTTTTTMMNDVVAPSSTAAASRDINNDNNNNNNNNSEGDNVPTRLPTKDELKKELYKLVDTDHSSRDESLQALHRLFQWNDIKDNYSDNLRFNDYFYKYAGLQIVLDFVEKFSNDAECVKSAMSVVYGIIYNCYHTKHRGEGTNILFNHGGIEILLQSSNKLIEGNLNGPKLEALESIWDLFGDIFLYVIDPSGTADRTADRTKIDTSSESFKGRFYSIVDSCLDLLTKIQSRDDRTSLDIMCRAFLILEKASRISTDMKDDVVNGEIRKKGIIPKTVEVFKMDDGSSNFRDIKLIGCALCMLVDLKKNNLLTQASDFQSLLPLLAVALKEFHGIYRGANILTTVLFLLEKATDTIENKSIIEKSGVLGALVPLLETDNTLEHVRKKVRNLVVKICTK